MKSVDAYKTSDGKLFEDYNKAFEHQQNIVGELLDELLPHDDRGHVTHADRFNLLTKMLQDDRLGTKIRLLHNALSFND